MDDNSHITETLNCKRRKHLDETARGIIWNEHGHGSRSRAIAKLLNGSPQTVGSELKRSAPEHKGMRGRRPVYSISRGQTVCENTRKRCQYSKEARQLQAVH